MRIGKRQHSFLFAERIRPDSDLCEKNNCKFALWKDNRFLTSKRVSLSSKMAEKLLKDGKAYVSGIYSEKTGKKYDAFIVMTDDGTKTTFGLDFTKGGTLNG